MTRDDFEKAVDKISLDYPFRHIVNYLKAHDTEQRAEIARLREALEGMLFIFGHNDGYAQVKTAKQAFKKE